MAKRGPKVPESIISDELCAHGCGNIAKFKNNTGILLCQNSANKCPSIRNKNKVGVTVAHKEGRLPGFDMVNRGWAKGLSKETDARVKKQADTKRGIRKTTDEEKLKRIIYREQCEFNLAGIIEKIEGYPLLVERGMYSCTTNKNGVVRDHIISVMDGFKNGIDPKLISHPANCRFIPHKDNSRKGRRSDQTVDELMIKINNWGNDGNW